MVNVSQDIVPSRFRSKRSESIYFTYFPYNYIHNVRYPFYIDLLHFRRKMRRWALYLFSCTRQLLHDMKYVKIKMKKNFYKQKVHAQKVVEQVFALFIDDFKQTLRSICGWLESLYYFKCTIFSNISTFIFSLMDKYFKMLFEMVIFFVSNGYSATSYLFSRYRKSFWHFEQK